MSNNNGFKPNVGIVGFIPYGRCHVYEKIRKLRDQENLLSGLEYNPTIDPPKPDNNPTNEHDQGVPPDSEITKFSNNSAGFSNDNFISPGVDPLYRNEKPDKPDKCNHFAGFSDATTNSNLVDGGIPFVITQDMRLELHKLGYDDAAIGKLDPFEAHRIINEGDGIF